jgi:hypothetical protein
VIMESVHLKLKMFSQKTFQIIFKNNLVDKKRVLIFVNEIKY